MQDQKWSDKKQTKIFLRDLDKFHNTLCYIISE